MIDEVLKELKSSKDYVSGQAISEKLGISRTAVWKIIKKLIDKGYFIECANKLGYKLIDSTSVFSVDEIKNKLTVKSFKNNIFLFKEVDSTNKLAKIKAEEGALDKSIYIAETQTGGKGRLSKTWGSSDNDGLYFSILLRPKTGLLEISKITLITAVAVCTALRNLHVDCKIKWPNDIVLNGKKVCGILTEMSVQSDTVDYIVIGIGINLNNKTFDEQLKNTATSIFIESGKINSKSSVVSNVLNEFNLHFEKFFSNKNSDEFIEIFNNMCVNINEKVIAIYKNNKITGIALGINSKGELLIKNEDREFYINSGEVSIRSENLYK